MTTSWTTREEVRNALRNGEPISQADMDAICANAVPGAVSVIRVTGWSKPVAAKRVRPEENEQCRSR